VTDLQITYRSIGELSANPRNARSHSARQIRQIGRSIDSFGFVNPVLVDEHDVIIAGHGRLAASEKLGLDRIPVIRIAGLSETQKRGLMLADNRIAENAGWDSEMLARELSDLSAMELDFDLEVTGFDMAEIDLAIEGLVDVYRARLEFPDLRRRIRILRDQYKAQLILIEEAGSGVQLVQDLKQDGGISVRGIIPRDDKATRLLSVSHLIEGGQIAVPADAPWIAEFQREITLFPNGKHDDQVDSLTQFLKWLAEPSAEPRIRTL
jgi:predicted phage terminase large subunit-like protein